MSAAKPPLPFRDYHVEDDGSVSLFNTAGERLGSISSDEARVLAGEVLRVGVGSERKGLL